MPRRICAYTVFAATSRTHTPRRSRPGLWSATLFATHSWEHMTVISMMRIISRRKANHHPPRFEQSPEFTCGQRPAEVKALHHVTIEPLQETQLFGGLHAFGDHTQAQTSRHADHRSDDCRIIVIHGQVAHKLLGDLWDIDRGFFYIKK